VVVGVALLLGLRHATDPDHLVAVSTLVAVERDRLSRRATVLGLAWGLGHATAILALGLPFVFLAAVVPSPVARAAEVLVGLVIMMLAVRLVLRWKRRAFHAHAHAHGGVVHRHLHAHASRAAHDHAHDVRSPTEAYGIGLLHGVGGSAAVAVLVLASIPGTAEAVAALVAFAVAAALAMALLSAVIGAALAQQAVQRRFVRLAPVLASLTFGFGAWYAAAGALGGTS
jgi:high-affinity nickel permease